MVATPRRRPPVDLDWRPPTVPFAQIQARIRAGWGEEAPGIVVLSQIRAGKTHLVRRGILPLVGAEERVLIVDCKGDDPQVTQIPARAVDKIPPRWRRGSRRDRGHWLRLVVSDNVARGQAQLDQALELVWREGDWVVYWDEARSTSGRQAPDYNRPALMNRLVLRGGYKGIRTIIGTQTPSWVNRETFSQRSFIFAGHIHDEDAQKRVAQVVGNQRKVFPFLPKIRRRWWLYSDEEDQEQFFALTTPPA